MLFYLDNWLSADPKAAEELQNAARRGRGRRTGAGNAMPQQQQQGPRRNGLNENYARELLELHTLGVDGGYTQQDVVELARCLTGWTIEGPRRGGKFIFRPAMHDNKQKVVLGHVIPAGGDWKSTRLNSSHGYIS